MPKLGHPLVPVEDPRQSSRGFHEGAASAFWPALSSACWMFQLQRIASPFTQLISKYSSKLMNMLWTCEWQDMLGCEKMWQAYVCMPIPLILLAMWSGSYSVRHHVLRWATTTKAIQSTTWHQLWYHIRVQVRQCLGIMFWVKFQKEVCLKGVRSHVQTTLFKEKCNPLETSLKVKKQPMLSLGRQI